MIKQVSDTVKTQSVTKSQFSRTCSFVFLPQLENEIFSVFTLVNTPFRALKNSSLSDAVLSIFFIGALKKMLRIYAKSVIALMTYKQSFIEMRSMNFKRSSVSFEKFSAKIKVTVSVSINRPFPHPAIRGFLWNDKFKKSLFECRRNILFPSRSNSFLQDFSTSDFSLSATGLTSKFSEYLSRMCNFHFDCMVFSSGLRSQV